MVTLTNVYLEQHKAIDSADWTFNLTPEDKISFVNKTEMEPDLLEYLGNNISKPFIDTTRIAAFTTPTVKILSEAILRQVSFVDKMERQLWIRSPYIDGTLRRATDRYCKFLKLLKLYPGTMLVPTLDIDLGWHTHQCSAARYENYTTTITGRYIDHDDKLGARFLVNGMEKTKQLFRIRFGQEYLVCCCWDCQAILSEVEALERPGIPVTEITTVSQTVATNVAFYRAVEIARRAHKPLPKLNDEAS